MLLASIENMQYAVTVDVIHTVRISFHLLFHIIGKWYLMLLIYLSQVFSAFGTVQKIAIFEKNGQTQALVQYPGNKPFFTFFFP